MHTFPKARRLTRLDSIRPARPGGQRDRRAADLMVWTRPGGSLGEEVVPDGIESGGAGYGEARVSGAWC
jgi:hypothetical protein